MFSGGLDSTYVLHKILTDQEYAEYDVHVHHMRLVNSEKRAAAEEITTIDHSFYHSPIPRKCYL